MVYFRCTSSGSGKGNTVIVTCAEQFAGVAITIAKIGKSYTKVCPLSAPYVVKFYGVEAGTYTVSATVSGQTYSAEVIVQDVSCVLNYGFTWKTWVDTASQLDSTDYASLSEVLADEEAVRELFLEHACVDYMADSTSSNADLETIIDNNLCAKWINNSDYALDFLGANTVIKALMDTADKYGYGEWVVIDDTTTPPTYGPKGNVPVMTANAAPYGEASGSSVYDSRFAYYYPFAGASIINSWTSANSLPAYISYKFTNPVCVKRAMYVPNNTMTAKLQASNDGFVNDIHDLTDDIVQTSGSTPVYVNVDNNDYYLYYRWYVTSAEPDSSNRRLASYLTLQFYGRELKVSVPTMTSNTAPFGECSASSVSSSTYPAWHAFNDNINDGHYAAQGSRVADYYLRYQFTTLTRAKVAFIRYLPNNYTFTCKLKGSNDGSTWYDCSDSFTLQGGTDRYNTIVQMTATDGYKKYEIVMESATAPDASWLEIADLRIYGLDYSEKEFEVGTTKKWLYDHGVELEELTKTANAYTDGPNPTVAPTFESNEIVLNTPPGSTCLVGTENVQDLSDYNLLRCFIRWELLGETKNGQMGVLSSKAWSSPVAQVLLTADSMLSNYPQIGLDISNVASGNIANRTYGQGEQRYTIQELWLE